MDTTIIKGPSDVETNFDVWFRTCRMMRSSWISALDADSSLFRTSRSIACLYRIERYFERSWTCVRRWSAALATSTVSICLHLLQVSVSISLRLDLCLQVWSRCCTEDIKRSRLAKDSLWRRVERGCNSKNLND